MNIKLKVFLDKIEADDNFWISVTTAERNVYFGYADQLPEELGNLIVQNVYIDWASNALGIYVV